MRQEEERGCKPPVTNSSIRFQLLNVPTIQTTLKQKNPWKTFPILIEEIHNSLCRKPAERKYSEAGGGAQTLCEGQVRTPTQAKTQVDAPVALALAIFSTQCQTWTSQQAPFTEVHES